MLLVFIETASRYLVVYPMKKKSDTTARLEQFISNHTVDLLEADASSEFTNNAVKKLLERDSIPIYTTTVKTHTSLVESKPNNLGAN